MFTPRPVGSTLRRLEESIHRPHSPAERFDPEFPVAMRCAACGKVGHGPRKQMAEAMREHQTQCPARHSAEPQLTRIFYPRR